MRHTAALVAQGAAPCPALGLFAKSVRKAHLHMAANVKKVRKHKLKVASWPRLDTWARGVIWGMHLGGLDRASMQEHFRKKDRSLVSMSAIPTH